MFALPKRQPASFAPTKSISVRFRPVRSSFSSSWCASSARRPPGTPVMKRSCAARIAASSLGLSRFHVSCGAVGDPLGVELEFVTAPGAVDIQPILIADVNPAARVLIYLPKLEKDLRKDRILEIARDRART